MLVGGRIVCFILRDIVHFAKRTAALLDDIVKDFSPLAHSIPAVQQAFIKVEFFEVDSVSLLIQSKTL